MTDPTDIALTAVSTGAGAVVTLKGWPLLLKLFKGSENGNGHCKAGDVGDQLERIAQKLDSVATEMTKAGTLLNVIVDRMK